MEYQGKKMREKLLVRLLPPHRHHRFATDQSTPATFSKSKVLAVYLKMTTDMRQPATTVRSLEEMLQQMRVGWSKAITMPLQDMV